MLIDKGELDEALGVIKSLKKNGFEKKWLLSLFHFLSGDNEQVNAYIPRLNEEDLYNYGMMNNFIYILKNSGNAKRAEILSEKYKLYKGLE